MEYATKYIAEISRVNSADIILKMNKMFSYLHSYCIFETSHTTFTSMTSRSFMYAFERRRSFRMYTRAIEAIITEACTMHVLKNQTELQFYVRTWCKTFTHILKEKSSLFSHMFSIVLSGFIFMLLNGNNNKMQ